MSVLALKQPRLTAIVTCRNAAPTLERLLDNLAFHEAEVVVIDNDSTDQTQQIARARAGSPVVDVHLDQYRGYFDLSRQLRRKRDIINNISDGWIIHADADEFIDSPDGGSLRDYLSYWEQSAVTAFTCQERMFLPESETDRHIPETFEDTMTAYVNLVERNPKQRLFRAGVSLDRWLATGGHTVTSVKADVAPVTLPLRHYFGLSLDQVRAEYLSRVYAVHDLAKFWHATRRVEDFEIVAPSKDVLQRLGTTDAIKSETKVPVFRPRNKDPSDPKPVATVDLSVVGQPKATREIGKMLAQHLPGLRLQIGQASTAGVPVLHVLSHPAASHKKGQSVVDHATGWLRQTAGCRQQGLLQDTRYCEIRIEDIGAHDKLVIDATRKLLTQGGVDLLQKEQLLVHSDPNFTGRLFDITGPMARDFGYGQDPGKA